MDGLHVLSLNTAVVCRARSVETMEDSFFLLVGIHQNSVRTVFINRDKYVSFGEENIETNFASEI